MTENKTLSNTKISQKNEENSKQLAMIDLIDSEIKKGHF